MIQINHVRDLCINNHPLEVQETVRAFAELLDENYGVTRDPKRDLGGYILIIEEETDILQPVEHLDWEDTIPEYVERIPCYIGGDYSIAHFQLSSDYSITVFMPMSLLPEQLKKYLEE